jgi:hypothetical protein
VFKKKPVPIPEASKFDRMGEIELYQAMETALGEACHLADNYQREMTERGKVLALMEPHLETALAANRALRRRMML